MSINFVILLTLLVRKILNILPHRYLEQYRNSWTLIMSYILDCLSIVVSAMQAVVLNLCKQFNLGYISLDKYNNPVWFNYLLLTWYSEVLSNVQGIFTL